MWLIVVVGAFVPAAAAFFVPTFVVDRPPANGWLFFSTSSSVPDKTDDSLSSSNNNNSDNNNSHDDDDDKNDNEKTTRTVNRSFHKQDPTLPIYARARPEATAFLQSTNNIGSDQRPGAVIETADQMKVRQEIQDELQTGSRDYSRDAVFGEETTTTTIHDYGELKQDVEAPYDNDDPTALDAATLGNWGWADISARFPYEWDPLSDPDPNQFRQLDDDDDDDDDDAPPHQYVSANPMTDDDDDDDDDAPPHQYVSANPMTDDGVEVGYNPAFGPSNPIDVRTERGTTDSYMIDPRTADKIPAQFVQGDPEIALNQDVVMYRQSRDFIETHVDPFLNVPVPRRTAVWHGYPAPVYLVPSEKDHPFAPNPPLTFDPVQDPSRARDVAVQQARSQNAPWMPVGTSEEYHARQRAPYQQLLVGTLRVGPQPAELVAQIQPALDVLKGCVHLLSIQKSVTTTRGIMKEEEEQPTNNNNDDVLLWDENDPPTVYRFHYHGLMKDKYGMSCWTRTLLEDCGVTVTGVVFETGFRRRDAAYDGGDPWYGPSVSVSPALYYEDDDDDDSSTSTTTTVEP